MYERITTLGLFNEGKEATLQPCIWIEIGFSTNYPLIIKGSSLHHIKTFALTHASCPSGFLWGRMHLVQPQPAISYENATNWEAYFWPPRYPPCTFTRATWKSNELRRGLVEIRCLARLVILTATGWFCSWPDYAEEAETHDEKSHFWIASLI